jgi:ribosomal protein L35
MLTLTRVAAGLRRFAAPSFCRRLPQHAAPLHTLLTRSPSACSTPPPPPWLSPLRAPAAAAARAPSLLQHLLGGAVRWKGGTHPRRPHSFPPRHRKKPKVKKGASQRGERYKLKTHQGAMKRFYQKGDGTWMHKAAGKSHLMAGTSRRRQSRRLIKHRPVTSKGFIKKLNKLMPYGSTLQPPTLYRQPLMWDRPEGWTEMFYAAKRDDGVEVVAKMMKEAKAREKERASAASA